MNIVWFSWKDIDHPAAGGAEKVSHEIMKRLVRDGHSVRLITALYSGATQYEKIDGIEVFRSGGRHSVYLRAYFLFKKNMKNWPDLVIDEMNTVPFGCAFYVKKPTILLTYQLARQVWFAQAMFPLSVIGFILEPLYLFILSRKYRTVLTESESTRKDLQKYGFSSKDIHTFRVGIELGPIMPLKPVNNLDNVLILGAVRPMKRTLSAVKGFEYARDKNSSLRLTIAGDIGTPYAKKVLAYINASRHKDVISILGRVSADKKLSLMRSADVILVTSVKEGWGLIVTEANSQGTPAIAFDSDGLRDSITNGKTGLLVPPGDEKALGDGIINLLSNKQSYELMRSNAWQSSKQYTFDNSYLDFVRLAKIF